MKPDALTEAVEKRRELSQRINDLSGQIDALQLRLDQAKDARQALMLTHAGLTATIKQEAKNL